MIRLSKKSKLDPAQVVEKAIEFFGAPGVGLDLQERGEGCVTFTGGGGYVAVQCCEKESHTEVDVETREWDYQVKQFLGKI